MAGDIITASGTKIYIGAAVTADQADTLIEFQAMTGWTEIGLVETIGELGDKSNIVKFSAIGDKRVRKSKASRDAGDLAVTVAHDPDDAGQIAMDAAEAADAPNDNFAFKVVLPDNGNTVKYFRALVAAVPLNIGTNDNVVRKMYQVGINSAIFTD